MVERNEIKEVTEPVWKQRYCQPPSSKWRWWLLPAAALCAIAVVLVLWKSQQVRVAPAPFTVARVDRVFGPAFSGVQPLRVGAESAFAAGSVVETADSDDAALSLRLSGGQSVRLKPRTRIRLVGPLLVDLERGTVYFDSLGASTVAPVSIATRLGAFKGLGTQYEVKVEGATVELRVREGLVQLSRDGDAGEAKAGEKLTLGNDGSVDIGEAPLSGETWDWVLKTAPMLDIEGRPLRAFLDWIAREKGLELQFENARAETLASTVALHGSIRSLDPDEALRKVAIDSGFQYRVEQGRLVISGAGS